MTTRHGWRFVGALVLAQSVTGCAGSATNEPSPQAPEAIDAIGARAAAAPRTAHEAAEGDIGACFLFGEGYAFLLKPPPGWRALCGDQLPQGRQELAIVLPDAASADSIEPPFMYLGVSSKPIEQSVEDFIMADNQRIRASAKEASQAAPEMIPRAALAVADGTASPVWLYEQPSTGRYELTAFVAHDSVVILVSTFARDRAGVESLTRPFAELVRSVRFVSSDALPSNRR